MKVEHLYEVQTLYRTGACFINILPCLKVYTMYSSMTINAISPLITMTGSTHPMLIFSQIPSECIQVKHIQLNQESLDIFFTSELLRPLAAACMRSFVRTHLQYHWNLSLSSDLLSALAINLITEQLCVTGKDHIIESILITYVDVR